jgi:glyoxylase-like metal-dependent hydrolase (beta-lactamase superfamily II)
LIHPDRNLHEAIRPMKRMKTAPMENWFQVTDAGSGVLRIRERFIVPFVACNIWLIKGEKRYLLLDSGTGLVSLKKSLPALFDRPVVSVSSHTHFDHAGGAYEFEQRLVHESEARVMISPDRDNTTVEGFMSAELFEALPFDGFDPDQYRVRPAPPTGLLAGGDVIDLGGRRLDVLHLPGHSPGLLGLYEEENRILFSSDAVYDGHLYDDVYHSDVKAYIATMERLSAIPASVVHGGHFESFGAERLRTLARSYIQSRKKGIPHAAR